MLQLSITMHNFDSIILTHMAFKNPKKFPFIPQLIIRRLSLYEFRGKLILLHQEVMLFFKGLLYTVMAVIVHSVAIKLNSSTFTQLRRLVKAMIGQ